MPWMRDIAGYRDKLIPLTQQLLGVPVELVETALDLELQDGTVVADEVDGRRCIFLAGLYHSEVEIAEWLRLLANGDLPWQPIDADKAMPWVEGPPKLRLAEPQSRALRT